MPTNPGADGPHGSGPHGLAENLAFEARAPHTEGTFHGLQGLSETLSRLEMCHENGRREGAERLRGIPCPREGWREERPRKALAVTGGCALLAFQGPRERRAVVWGYQVLPVGVTWRCVRPSLFSSWSCWLPPPGALRIILNIWPDPGTLQPKPSSLLGRLLGKPK